MAPMIKNLIAFRGLKRSWRYCLEDTLKDILGSFRAHVDAGMQVVDFLFVSYASEQFTDEEKEWILNLIGSKYEVFWETIDDPHVKVGGYLTIGYGGWRVNRWKIEHEVEWGETYDRVFETRYDTAKRYLNPTWPALVNFMPKEFHIYVDRKEYQDDSVLPVVLNDFTILTSGSTHDVWGYSYMKNSDSMMKLASVFDTTTGFNSRFGAGEGWGIVFRKSGLVIDEHPMQVPIIIRTEQFGYKPVLYIPPGRLDAALAPVCPRHHYSESLGDDTQSLNVLNMFELDTVRGENAFIPALIMQIMNYYRFDLTFWPKEFTVLCDPKDKETLKDLFAVSGLRKPRIVAEMKVEEPIALLSGIDILSNQIYRYSLRFDPVNNTEISKEQPDIVLFGGIGEPRETEVLISHNTEENYIVFGDTSIWKVNPSVVTKHTNWSGSALIKSGVSKLAYDKLPDLDKLVKGVIVLPKIRDDAVWKQYKQESHRYVMYQFNSRTVMHVLDKQLAEDIFNYIVELVPAERSGNFISWPYKCLEEMTILNFIDSVVP